MPMKLASYFATIIQWIMALIFSLVVLALTVVECIFVVIIRHFFEVPQQEEHEMRSDDSTENDKI